MSHVVGALVCHKHLHQTQTSYMIFYFLMPQSFLDIVTFDCVLESAPSEE